MNHNAIHWPFRTDILIRDSSFNVRQQTEEWLNFLTRAGGVPSGARQITVAL